MSCPDPLQPIGSSRTLGQRAAGRPGTRIQSVLALCRILRGRLRRSAAPRCRGPSGEYVVAAEATRSVVCLGLRCGAVALQGRPDAPVAVGLLRSTSAFPSPHQGRGGIRAGLNGSVHRRPVSHPHDRSSSGSSRCVARRQGGSRSTGAGRRLEDAWRRARERARRHRRPRS